jgi:hypothetical protein
LWQLRLSDGTVMASTLIKPDKIVKKANVLGVKDFASKRQIQRPGFALNKAGDKMYIAFAGYNDMEPFCGWLLCYEAGKIGVKDDAGNDGLLSAFCTLPMKDAEGSGAGIWQAGQGPALDEDGKLYVMTGNVSGRNAAHGHAPNNRQFGCTVLRLEPDLTLKTLKTDKETHPTIDDGTYFTPHDAEDMSRRDDDLGSGGILLIPGTKYAVGGGKRHLLYLMDRNKLGGQDTQDRVLQAFDVWTQKNDGDTQNADHHGQFHTTHNQKGADHHIHGSPAYFQTSNSRYLYVWAEELELLQLTFKDDLNAPPYFMSLPTDGTQKSNLKGDPEDPQGGSLGMPGGFLTVSSDGKQDGILWANHPWRGDANNKVVPGVLRAFNATKVQGHGIWSSRSNVRDHVGNFAKFCPPTVAKGKVLQATMGGLEQLETQYDSLPRTTTSTQSEGINLPTLKDRGSPALASWEPTHRALILAWAGTDGSLQAMFSEDGLTWNTQATQRVPAGQQPKPDIHPVGQKSSYQPSLACDGGTIYMAYTDASSSAAVRVYTSTNVISWSPANPPTIKISNVDVASAYSPALAAQNRTLAAAIVDPTTKKIRVFTSPATSTALVWTEITLTLPSTMDLESRNRPWLVYNRFTGDLVLAWPSGKSGAPNLFPVAGASTTPLPNLKPKHQSKLTAATVNISPKVPDTSKNKNTSIAQQPPDNVTEFGFSLAFMDHITDSVGGVVGQPVLAFTSLTRGLLHPKETNGRESFGTWGPLNCAVADDSKLTGFNEPMTRFRMFYDERQRSTDGPSLCWHRGKMHIAWVYMPMVDKASVGLVESGTAQVNLGTLNPGSVCVYGIVDIPTPAPNPHPAARMMAAPAIGEEQRVVENEASSNNAGTGGGKAEGGKRSTFSKLRRILLCGRGG